MQTHSLYSLCFTVKCVHTALQLPIVASAQTLCTLCVTWIDQANDLHCSAISHDHRSLFPEHEPPNITLQLQVLPGLPSILDW